MRGRVPVWNPRPDLHTPSQPAIAPVVLPPFSRVFQTISTRHEDASVEMMPFTFSAISLSPEIISPTRSQA